VRRQLMAMSASIEDLAAPPPRAGRSAGGSGAPAGRGSSSRSAPLLVTILATAIVASLAAAPAGAQTLPDNRAYEMVSPVDKNGVVLGGGVLSDDGNRVNFQAIGACCGATTAAVNLFQAERSESGWATTSITPDPLEPLVGLLQEQAPMDWTSDLTQTIFITPASYDPGDDDDERLDLYLAPADGGTPTWISQGSIGGTQHAAATLGLATRDFQHVAFTSEEALTPEAAAQPLTTNDAEYLYLRDVAAGTTSLVNVDTAGNLISTEGAILGNADFIDQQYIPANFQGTDRNAISSDGSKVFFQSPPGGFTSGPAHLYMRDLVTGTTTPLDDPASPEPAQYEGASDDGSLVFFTGMQGLAGDPDPTTEELYGFNTTDAPIGPAAPMSVFRVSGGEGGTADGDLIGITAVANDGSHVFFVAKGVLASNANSEGETATAGEPNMYVYNTADGTTTFIATLVGEDVFNCGFGGCNENFEVGLVDQPDVNRPAVPTPDGSVFVFSSTANLTGGAPGGPETTLTADAPSGEAILTVDSTEGLFPGRVVRIGNPPFFAEQARIGRVIDDTHIRLAGAFGGVIFAHDAGEPVVQLPPAAIYRYETASGALDCVSCPPPGFPASDASFGPAAGGAYGPTGVPMSADGSRIFFNSDGPLVAEDVNGDTPPAGPFGARGTMDVYEWQDGEVFLISDGRSPGSRGATTTPSGNDVLFSTNGRLVPQDQDGYSDLYTARVGGGIDPPPDPPPPCSGEDCRPPPTPPPPDDLPGSVTFRGSGNLGVAALSPAQVQQFARTARLTLNAEVPAAGQLQAKVLAKLRHGRYSKVYETSRQASAAGEVALSVRLSKAARKELARRGRLAVRINVSFGDAFRVADLVLRSQR
jgi:hypothetical protein